MAKEKSKESCDVLDASSTNRFVAPWADGQNMRAVEKDVMVPKLMKEKAMVLCKEYVDDFVRCSKGRTISMVWSCREAADSMRKCLESHYYNENFQQQCTKEYLENRSQFQQEYVETGKTKKPKKKESSTF